MILDIPAELDDRLTRAARRLGKSRDEAALAALLAWVSDCEEAAAQAALLSGGDGEVFRPPAEFYD